MNEKVQNELLNSVVAHFYQTLSDMDLNNIVQSDDLSFVRKILQANQPTTPILNPEQLLSQLGTPNQFPTDLTLVNPIPGLFVVTCSRKSFEELRGIMTHPISARGVAVLIPRGTDFILLPTEEAVFDDETNINLRHETSHIVFKHLVLQGLAISQEKEDLYKKVHTELVDELLASICGENSPHTYSRTIVARQIQIPQDLEQTYYRIYDAVEELRASVDLTEETCQRIAEVALKSTTLQQLADNLVELRKGLAKNASTNTTSNAAIKGWGNI